MSSVMLIDEERRLESTLTKILAGSNIALDVVANVTAAKRRLLQSAPALILCSVDFTNGEHLGIKFCGELKGHPALANVPVILLTDRPEQFEEKQLRDAGARGVLPYSVEADALRNKLASFLGLKVAEDPKLKLAQQLLAKVLHDLKTSDLLGVVELEDVPRVVFEMTRAICGQKEGAGGSKKAGSEAEIDLESAFGIKHPKR